MEKDLVGYMPGDKLGIVIDFASKLRDNPEFEGQAKLFLQGKNPFEKPANATENPLDKFVAKTTRMLSKRFGKRIVVPSLPPAITAERLAEWEKFNMRPVFLPDEGIAENRKLKNFVKPENWFYRNVASGGIKPIRDDLPPTKLEGRWYVADFTISADYTDGSQVFVNDPLTPIISELRKNKQIGRYDNTPQGSRFAITWDEWQNCVLAYVASKLGVTRAQIRLERAVDFNAIGNLYDANRGKFNAWEWFQDHFGDSHRLCGGFRDYGGLADVDYHYSGYRSGIIAVRPLVSFVN